MEVSSPGWKSLRTGSFNCRQAGSLIVVNHSYSVIQSRKPGTSSMIGMSTTFSPLETIQRMIKTS